MMRRQKLRKALILISFLFFPITIYYLSPVLIVAGAAKGVVTGSFIVFGLMFLAALVLGRGFCGWVCPGAGLQEACFSVRDKEVKKGDWIKYAIWIPWIGIIVYFFFKAGGITSIDPLFQISHGISVSTPEDFIPFYVVVALIVVPALAVGKRSFCHHICWMAPFMVLGRKVRNAAAWPSLGLKAEQENCIQCGRCTDNCPMSLDVRQMVEEGFMEKSECILCGTCADTCPQKVIRYTFSGGS